MSLDFSLGYPGHTQKRAPSQRAASFADLRLLVALGRAILYRAQSKFAESLYCAAASSLTGKYFCFRTQNASRILGNENRGDSKNFIQVV